MSSVYSLEGRNLKLTSREDVEPYIAELNAIEDLQEIHLGGNTLGVGACQALGEALQTKKNLRVANFADIFTGRLISEIPDALRALCDSLVDHSSLVEINLSDNAFGGRSAEPMVNFLTHNHHFSILKLNNNGLGIQGGKIVATALIEAASELEKLGLPSKLKTVICGRNRLEDGSAPTWAKAYASHGKLEEVRMFQNGIRMDGIIALSQGLASCSQLRVLDLQDNTATLRGSRGIAASLSKWTDLEVLNLSDCLLKPRGGYLVIDALSKGSNGNLKTLQLQYCDLDRKALDLLGKVIEGGAIKELEKLEINGNWADEEDECIVRIKEGLEKQGHGEALDELDEMDPDGEDDDEEEEEEEEEEGKGEDESGEEEEKGAVEEEKEEEEGHGAAETAAAAVAVPAATAAVAGAGLAAAAANSKEEVTSKMDDLDLSSARPKEEDRQEFAPTKQVDEVLGSAKEDEDVAQDAADVAQTAQEVPEEKVTAENAAEVAVSAEEVQKSEAEGQSRAQVAEEVAAEADRAGVGNAREAEKAMVTEEEVRKETAGTADQVAKSAEMVHASEESKGKAADEDRDLADMMAKTSLSAGPSTAKATTAKHGKGGSVDLSGELYADEGRMRTTPLHGKSDETKEEEPAKKKSGFRAAMGAVRELLR